MWWGGTSAILDTLSEDLDERRIIKRPRLGIPLNLPQIKIPLPRIRIQSLSPSCKSQSKIHDRNLGHVLARKDLFREGLSPFVVAIRDGGVPAVEEVEFQGDLVSYARGGAVGGVDVWA